MAFLLNPWRSHVQRICFLAIKIIFLQLTFTTLLLEILDRDNPFPLETSQSKTLNTIKLGLISGVLLESLVSIALNGLLPCIVVLALNAVELGILSWLATGLVDSSDGGASISATVSLVFSGLFFILRLADVFLLSSSMTSLMAPSDLLMLQVQYKPPHWERWLRYALVTLHQLQVKPKRSLL
ncbi:hypothetical protein DL96DRAFT_1611282 [Flagelloscypha sp. PMI_526]|nr:hypothetical protein DL96DRAFT_1611282 [Flagelloscypha sp. PMI_526]